MQDSSGAFANTREPLSFPDDLVVTPEGLVTGPAARDFCVRGTAFALAGGPLAFTHARIGDELLAAGDLHRAAAETDMAAALERLTAPRRDFAGLQLSGPDARPRIMGVCNVTPDSFSDGGDHADTGAAIAFGRQLASEGADIVDVGGESTRPGAAPVSVDEECARVLPVVEALAADGITVSIDTRKAAVMRAARDAGATIVNDVSALADDGAIEVVAETGASVILMHMQGTPETMQAAPAYDDVVADVVRWLATRVARCVAAGIDPARIAVDPGFGFGKTVDHNAALLRGLAAFHGLGCALAVGLSRKSFIGVWTGEADPKARVSGSVAAALAAVERGAQIVRVHDVAETRRAIDVWRKSTGLAA
ncbi:MAG: dihydropteroate synthase [Alphaproteobacteria bacterium]|nr:dihydropteroate synthase [Alphaproteobacteria bacterium]